MTTSQNRTPTQAVDHIGEDGEPRHTVAAADAPTAPAGLAEAAGDSPVVAELDDRWRRAVAEVDNVRKRFERQLTEQVRAERVRTAAAFLPVLDNLELALRHATADPAAIVAGVEAVHAQASAVLAGLGIERIGRAGEPFDPARHEAARVVPADDTVAPGTVVEVTRPGYVDGAGALVRAAVVTVAQAQQ